MLEGPSFRLGIDVGGTFTDLALVNDQTGQLFTEKVLTTPSDPWMAIRDGLLRITGGRCEPSQIQMVIHATTLVINALIERRGARVGLVTTMGFRDVLHFQRENRYDIYDPDLVLPEPLVTRRHRKEVSERLAGDGSVLRHLDRAEVRDVVRELLDDRVESIAVCLLHSYLRPDHELAVHEVIRELAPELPASLSHQVHPQIREFERMSATVINAYVQPLAQRYLGQLEQGLRQLGFAGPLYLMNSSGGLVGVETAKSLPIQLAESGPAAGTLIATRIGAQTNVPNLLSFDMGGTTAKACVVRDLEPLISRTYEVARVRRLRRGSGLPLGIPVVDLLEIGAGGGSIAEIDALGLLRVGPRSASASPGPACYDNGGTEPTVTDANVVLGLIDPDAFLGGSMRLNEALARRAIGDVARPLGLSVTDAAIAIHRVVTESMAEAARVHAVEVNADVRKLTLVAFGGAGPIHAAGVARRLGIGTVIFPREAGVLSAIGLLTAPLAFESSRSLIGELTNLDFHEVNALLHKLESESSRLLREFGAVETRVQRSVDMSYVGQRYEVTTLLPEGPLDRGQESAVKLAFDSAYERAYGRGLRDLPARCVTWRVRVTGPAPKTNLGDKVDSNGSHHVPSQTKSRRVWLVDGGLTECEVVPRSALSPGQHLTGPLLVQEAASTIVIPSGGRVRIDLRGNLIMELAIA